MGALEFGGVWRTTASQQDVWDVVVDLGTWPRWWPAIESVEVLAGSRTAPEAAVLTFATPAPLRPLRVEVAVTGCRAPEQLDVVAVDGAVRGTGRLVLEPEADGSATRFALRFEIRSRLLRPVERLLAGAVRNGGRDRLRLAGDELARLAGGRPRQHEL